MVETPNRNESTLDTPSCVHHWVLSEPEAGMISGSCKRCGVDRLFPARPEGLDRFDDFAPTERPAVRAERTSA